MVEEAFWTFVDQKWRDSLNVAEAELARWDQGANYRKGPEAARKGEGKRQIARKALSAGVHMAKDSDGKAALCRAPKKCKFTELAECTSSHPLWLCKAFGDKTPEEKNKIIMDNKLCPFCLLHSSDEVYFSKTNRTKPVFMEPGCKEQHIKWLHKMLKELPC
jgi:hypothetical protein